MGIVLFLALVLGVLVGGGFSCALASFALVAMSRAGVAAGTWSRFWLVSVVLLPLAWITVGALPLPEARPGSDYEIVARNLLVRGLGYGASPGLALVLALVVVPRLRRGAPSSS